MGVVNLAESEGENYTAWLRIMFPETGGKCDLVAFFFRRAYTFLRKGGTSGLIATNTVSQGDTRKSGLGIILKNGGTIYEAVRRYKWIGSASVVVSIIYFGKEIFVPKKYLDGTPVKYISHFLINAVIKDEPKPLIKNMGIAYLGCKPGSKGFIVSDKEGSLAPEIIANILRLHPEEKEIIYPYIGGKELNSNPKQEPEREVLYFGNKDPKQFPNLLNLLSQSLGRYDVATTEKKWWVYAAPAINLMSRISSFIRVLVIAEVSDSFAFTFQPNHYIFSNKIWVILLDSFSVFTCLQSSIHEFWARLTSSSMKDDLSYVASDSFETFPFPTNWENNPQLEVIGKEYYEYRAQLMIANNQGLTTTYNRFHDPDEYDSAILKLRDLHNQMDRAVLNAYGWTDLQPICEFLLDYEDEEETDDENTNKRQKKKPYR